MSERIFDTLLDVIRPNSARSGGAETSDDLREAYEPSLERVAQLCGEPSLDDLSHPHLADPFGTTPDEAREQAWAYRTFGVDADAFVRAHDVAVEGVVSATFDRLRAELGDEDALDRAEADLTSALDDVLGSAAAGVDAYGSPRAAADGGTRSGGSVNADLGPDASLPDRGDGGSSADESFPLGFREIMDNIGTALFILDADGNVVFWNRGAEKLTGESRETAYEYEMASRAFYHDGRRAKTLADKVLDAPESADEAYDVPRVDDVEYTLYRDTSTMTASGGEEKHISFSAAPLYRDGELVGVVEMVQDQTEIVERRNKTEDLVMELKGTMDAMQRGETDVRADFDHEGLLDEKLLTVVDSLNEMAEQFAVLAALTDQVAELHTHAEYVAETAQGVNDSALGQTETMEQISSEISNLSATIEEVASSAAQVDATSSQAEELATDGQESAEEAVSLLSDVSSSADDVTSDVAQLQERIDEIDEIITVINDIADQTNILALNASIEAARAGEAGEGFAVVADEVKQLAEESQQNATEIEELINNIQDDTEKTVSNLDETTRRVGEVIEQVEDAMSKLSDITDAITEASEGIQEVADATDDQASSTEEVASIVNQATEEAEEIADEIEGIVDANQEQMRKTEELRKTIDENTYH